MELKYISPAGAEIDLVNNPLFVLTGVDGMTDANADISSSTLSGLDGDIVNSVKAQPRSITLYFTINPGVNVETAKREVLEVIKHKATGTLHWEQNNRALEISGVVETITMPRFKEKVVLQLTMYCSQPYWEDAVFITRQIQLIIAMHHFRLTIPQTGGIVMGRYDNTLTRTFTNTGDAAVGITIHIIATGDIANPLLERSDGVFFGINDTMVSGDQIDICTCKGKKTVAKNGVNIMQKVKPGSTWLQLEVGENVLTISESGGANDMYYYFEYKQRYV